MARKKKATKVKEETIESTPEPIFEEEKPSFKQKLKKFFKILFGILVIVGGGFLIWLFFNDFLTVVKGAIGMFVILIGLFILLLAWLD